MRVKAKASQDGQLGAGVTANSRALMHKTSRTPTMRGCLSLLPIDSTWEAVQLPEALPTRHLLFEDARANACHLNHHLPSPFLGVSKTGYPFIFPMLLIN